MTNWTAFIGDVAVVTTVFQFLSGVLVCKQYVVNKTTAESSPLPFLTGVLSCFLWFLYGASKQDNRIVVVNMIGVTLMVAYTVVFYIFTFKKAALMKQVVLVFIMIAAVIVYVMKAESSDIVLEGLGYAASLVTLLTVASPMSKLFYVIKVKTTECLPFPMIVMSFFVSMLWTLYGFLNVDMILMYVNLIGTALATAQLCLFVVYPRTSKTPSLYKHILA